MGPPMLLKVGRTKNSADVSETEWSQRSFMEAQAHRDTR